jgi:hypothetical protein
MAEHLARPDFDARLDAFTLCREADRADDTAANLPDGTPAHEAARAEARRLHLEISRLRARIAAKPEKTFDDVAVLAIIALFYRPGEAAVLVKEASEPDSDDLCSDDRALLALLLAVLEVLGIRLDTFSRADSIPS